MAPSRGATAPSTTSEHPLETPSSKPTPGQAPSSSPDSSEAKQQHALKAERTASSDIKRNLSYLWNPAAASALERPSRLRTRALLRSLHSIGVFLYWRLYRWAKYAIVGAIVGAVGSFAFAGTMATGVGAIIAPTGIFASIAVGGVWWAARWAWGRATHKRERLGRAGKVPHERQVHPSMAGKEPELVPW